MKKISVFIILTITLVFAQNLYFSAFKDIQKAKKILNTNPQKAQTLFIEASSYLKQVINSSIDKNKPSVQAMTLLGEMYLKGWGGEQNPQKAKLLLCTAKNLGNSKAKTLIQQNGIKCPQKINLKELKQ
jgi:hypothetical protein